MKLYYITWTWYEDGRQDNVMFFTNKKAAFRKIKELEKRSDIDLANDGEVDELVFTAKSDLINKLNCITTDEF